MEDYKVFNRKLLFIMVIFFISFVIITGRLFYLQLLCDEDCIKNIVATEKIPYEVYKIITVPKYRGTIKDSEGTVLVLSVPSVSVYARPKACAKVPKEKVNEFIDKFSRISGISKRRLREIIYSDEAHKWIVRGVYRNKEAFKRNLQEILRDTSRRDEEGKNKKKEPGMSICIGYIDDFKRRYLYGRIAGNILGHVNVDGEGVEGIEYMFDEYLKGGVKKLYISYSKSLGRFVTNPVIDTGSIKDVKDVILTINLSAQKVVEEIKMDIVRRWKPKKVSIVVMDVETGEIVAMANYPDFDPNFFRRYSPSRKRNIAVTDLFEPGSTMKPLFIGYALDRKYIKRDMVIDTGKGVIEVYGRSVRDPKRLGKISLSEIIIHSSNVGAIKVAKRLKAKDVRNIMEMFHLNKTFGTFVGEAKPMLSDFSKPANILYASIGQGISFNTLNLTVAFGALATGYIVKPRILKRVMDSKGDVVLETKREILRDGIFSESTRKWLMRVLIDVVEKGTGRKAKSEYFYIAGKTGTAQKFDFSKGRYSRERVTTFFVGIFPATKPKFVASIVVDEPKGKNLFGGTVCAPYFKRLAENIAFFYRIKPDKRANTAVVK